MIGKSDISEKLKKLPQELKKLIEKRLELFALDFGNQITRILTDILYRLTGVIILALGLVFLIQSLAIFVGNLVNDQSLGFLIVAGPIVLLGLMFIMLRPKFLIRKTQGKMMDQILSSFNNEDETQKND